MESLSPREHTHGGTETSVTFASASGIVTTAFFAQPPHPTGRAVILCHGFLSGKNSRTNRRLTDLLVSESIATLRFDWYGMGDSPEDGARLSIRACKEQLDAAFRFLDDHAMPSLGLVGSSFGGFIAILSAPRHSHLRALGLKCPVVDFAEVLRLEFGPDAMEEWKRSDHIPNVLGGDTPIPVSYAFFEECLAYHGYASASHIHTPTLIVHGDHDEIIPSHQIDRLLEVLPGPKPYSVFPARIINSGVPKIFV